MEKKSVNKYILYKALLMLSTSKYWVAKAHTVKVHI